MAAADARPGGEAGHNTFVMKKIRAAVIGVGYLGRFHAQKYAQAAECELIAVSDARQEARDKVAAELPGIAGPNSEFVELKWLALADARKEKIPAITKVILEELENRLQAGFSKEASIPFFYSKNGKFHRDELA